MMAIKGKGIFPMMVRGAAIVNRYGITPTKIAGALGQLSSMLGQFGCQATIPVTALVLSRQQEIIHKYHMQGFELAVHGLSHVDYSQLPAEVQLEHIQKARHIFEQSGIPVMGFRSPYLRWNSNLLRTLSVCGFTYDSSLALAWDVIDGFKTSTYDRVLEFYGAQFAFQLPALPRLSDGLVQIPYCLPDDEALIERLHVTEEKTMAEIWLTIFARTYELGELFTLGIHPERTPFCQLALEAILHWARTLSPPVWIARLDEIVAWYTKLGQCSFEIQQEFNDRLRLKIQAPPAATILVRSLEVEAATEPWAGEYQRVMANEFTFVGKRKPIIGLGPDCPHSLQSFLRHQGYLIEINPNAQSFSYYLECSCFNPEDERPLLMDIEQGKWPLARIWRWPNTARCVLAITGDVDAFTYWDYGQRIFGK
jgi:peptidoglycan/xylan/chitin deacetylase (PgdA/CDA1 family)